MLELVANQTNMGNSAQISLGNAPQFGKTPYIYISSFVGIDTIYVTNSDPDSNTISVIDPDTNTVIGNIIVGKNPSYIARSGDFLYVTNSNDNTVSVIDPESNTVIKTITTVGEDPILLRSVGNETYVVNSDSDTVSVIDPESNTVIKNITVGEWPSYIDVYTPSIKLSTRSSIYVANSGSNTVSVIDPVTNEVIKNLIVGENPSFIESINKPSVATRQDTDKYVYVANTGNNTVSVINADRNEVIKNITVGNSPMFITRFDDIIYVANNDDDIISVIDPESNEVIKNITVGEWPSAIDSSGDFIYVANSGSNTVSVIDPVTNEVIKTIPVGNRPSYLKDFEGDTIYIANQDSNSLSVINAFKNDVVAGITFDIRPFGGGQIICDGLTSPTNRHMYISSGTKCTAKSNSGYEFASWIETLKGNSTRTINASTSPDWLIDPIRAFRNTFSEDQAAILTVDRFGNLTTYFKPLPPPVPTEYWTTLFGFVLSTILGTVLIPTFLSWRKSESQGRRLDYYFNEINSAQDNEKQYRNDMNDIEDLKDNITKEYLRLNLIRNKITKEYTRNKINKEQYDKLIDEISIRFRENCMREFDYSNILPEHEKVDYLKELRKYIEDLYASEKIKELHYKLLQNKISSQENN
jgi:YVTN family beta-propeller protein